MESTIIYNYTECENVCCGCGGIACKKIAPGKILKCEKGFICNRCLRHRPQKIYNEELEPANIFIKQHNMQKAINRQVIKPILRNEKFNYLKINAPLILIQFLSTSGGLYIVNVEESSLIAIGYPDREKQYDLINSIVEPKSMQPEDIYQWLKIIER